VGFFAFSAAFFTVAPPPDHYAKAYSMTAFLMQFMVVKATKYNKNE